MSDHIKGTGGEPSDVPGQYATSQQTVVSGRTGIVDKSTAVASVSGFYRDGVSTGTNAGSALRISVTLRNSKASELITKTNRLVGGKSKK